MILNRNTVFLAEQDLLTPPVRAALVALHDPALALNGCDGLLILAEGRVQGTLRPAADEPAAIEAALRILYGPVSVRRCQNRAGNPQLVLLKEEG